MKGPGKNHTPRAPGLPAWVKLVPPTLRRLFRLWSFEVPNEEGLDIYVMRRRIRVFRDHRLLYTLPIDRGTRPLKTGALALNGSLYYGDYWSNPQRIPANLYRIDLETGEKEVFYRFDWVRHIHFVREDREASRRQERRHKGRYEGGSPTPVYPAIEPAAEEQALLIGTGDSDGESGIYRLSLDRKELEAIGEGSKTFRAVSIIQLEGELLWGTDDPDGVNHIYRFDRRSRELTRLREIDGPAYYSTRDAEGFLYIATAVEDRRRHRAVIYRTGDGGKTWREYREFKKDFLPDKYFGHGIVEFLHGQEDRKELVYFLHGGLKDRNPKDPKDPKDRRVSGGRESSSSTFRPIFIVGVGRSGTSLLQSMLNSHSAIAFPPETHFIRTYLARGLSLDQARGKILKDPYLGNLGCDLQGLLEDSSDIVDFYRRTMQSYAAQRGKALVGDKDPKNVEHLRLIERHFPGALILHIYRDPRAVVASRLKAQWSKGKPLWQHILAYKAQFGYMHDHAGLFGENYLSLGYEELLLEPEKQLQRILDALGLPFEKEMLEFFRRSHEVVKGAEKSWKENLYKPVMAENIDKWRRELSEAQRRRIEGVLYKEMALCGYPRDYRSPARRLFYALAARLYRLLRCR